MMINKLRKATGFIKKLCWKLKFFYKLLIYWHKPRLFYLMGLGDMFPNLGDQAQSAAISIWLKKHFDMPIIELKNFEINSCLSILKRFIRSDDIVFLHSGGNFGDDWYGTQLDRELIISSISGNKIVQLPQTIFYSDTESTHYKVERSQKVIDEHPNLLIFGRDFYSEEIAKRLFVNTKILARPDMVLSLQDIVNKELEFEISRQPKIFKKILLILRNDKEGIYDVEFKHNIVNLLFSHGYEAQLWDTDVYDVFPDSAKLKTISKYLKFITEFDAVITDRYHGLIFSVLVKRPCIVMKTHNHKLTSAFDWFEHVNYVKRINSTDELFDTLCGMQKLSEYVSPKWNEIHFDPMAKEVKEFLSIGFVQN